MRSPSGGSSFPGDSEETDDEIGTVVDEDDDVVDDVVVVVEDIVAVVEDVVVVVVDEEDDTAELEETGGTYVEETEEDIGVEICEADPPEEMGGGSAELLSGGIDELSVDVVPLIDVL